MATTTRFSGNLVPVVPGFLFTKGRANYTSGHRTFVRSISFIDRSFVASWAEPDFRYLVPAEGGRDSLQYPNLYSPMRNYLVLRRLMKLLSGH